MYHYFSRLYHLAFLVLTTDNSILTIKGDKKNIFIILSF